MAEFLSNELLKQSENLLAGSNIVVGGGFPGDVDSKSSTFDSTNLCVNHEEEDTRMILHSRDAIDRGYKRLDVYFRDTDVLSCKYTTLELRPRYI